MGRPAGKISQKGSFELPKSGIKDGLAGLAGGAVVSILPGIGNSVAAATLRELRGEGSAEKYLVLLGSINTSSFFFSFAFLFAAARARNGVMLALSEKMVFAPDFLLAGLAVMAFAGGAGAILTILLSKAAAGFFSEKRTKILSAAGITAMVLMVFALSGPEGLAAMLFASALGMFVVINRVKRSCCMASLITPTVFFYLFYLL
jgi:TctA family transporter